MVAALGVAGNVLAQPAPTPAPEPTPTPTEPTTSPANPPVPPAPGPPPVAAQPPEVAPAPPPPPPTTFPTMAGPALKLSELFTIRPGIMLQLWAAFAQDAFKQTNGDNGAFAKNIYLRRARFFFGGGIGKNLTYFLLVETGNAGQPLANADGSTNKQFLTFNFNDAWLDYKVNPNVSIQGGLMIIPFTRNILQSTATYWSIDIAAVSATYIAATQTNVLRDVGAQVKINAMDNHFEARALVSQGIRLSDNTLSADPGTGMGVALPPGSRNPGKNDPRFTGYLQYNFLDPDAGYVFNGMYFGRKAIAGIGVGGDYQSVADNPYFATSATAFASIPIHGADPKNGGDEIGGQVEYLHFHGGNKISPAAGLGKQDAVFVEAGYYNKAAHLSLFGKFEGRFYEKDSLTANDSRLYGGGLKYFLAEQVANFTLQYTNTQFPKLVEPNATLRNSINTVQLQFQLAYY